MQVTEPYTSMLESLRENATVRTVYGDPVERDGITTVPVARVAYGFGGGYGSATESGSDEENRAVTESSAEESGSEGGGFGGGLMVSPLGVVEIDPEGTNFVRFDERRRLAGVLLLGAVLGFLLGRRGRAS